MGSGTNREWWSENGSRTSRRQNTKTTKAVGQRARQRIKLLRAEAKKRTRKRA